ncbi:hypothetical protein, partial [Rheinheimera sp.]|uniref:hypothetical protein n=1 Tax=Rheinheimera sp. TaxID=1869214 RepID=UPI0040487A07
AKRRSASYSSSRRSRVSRSASSVTYGSRLGNTIWARPSTWGSKYRDPFPAVEKYQLRYCQTIGIDPNVGQAASYLFRANSIYDPDFTGTGHQPYGHDQLEEIYNHYCVDSATITVTPTDGVQGIWGISVTDNSVVTSGFDTVVEQQATSVTGPSWNGAQMPTLKKTYNRHTSFPVYKDTSALMGANPAEEAYFQVWCRAKDAATNQPNSLFLVCITYNVTCYELKDLGSS